MFDISGHDRDLHAKIRISERSALDEQIHERKSQVPGKFSLQVNIQTADSTSSARKGAHVNMADAEMLGQLGEIPSTSAVFGMDKVGQFDALDFFLRAFHVMSLS